MDEGPLKNKLASCSEKEMKRSDWSISHRGGGTLQFPEHTHGSIMAGTRMGAGIQECDVTFTKDKQLVCRHSQCDLHTTTNVVAIPELNAKCTVPFKPASGGSKATAKCCTSDFTLDEIKTLCAKMDASDAAATTPAEYLGGTPGYRTDLYAKTCNRVLKLREYIDLVDGLGLKFTAELKTPEVPMPFPAGSDYTQSKFAQQLIDEFKAAGIKPQRVWLQSFLFDDLLYWIKAEPSWAKQAVLLDESADAAVTMAQAVANLSNYAQAGVKIVAPPLPYLVTVEDGKIVPSEYALTAKKVGLKIITWSLERSGWLGDGSGGGYYYSSIANVTNNEGDVYNLLHVLAQDHANAISWTFPPKCISQTPKNENGSRIDCLFTSTEFRNGHGISLVTATITASNLVGVEAFADRPIPLAAQHRDSLGPGYEIRPIQGKGQGVVARRRIRRGEIIMVDIPAVLIGISFLADTKPHHRRRILKQAINQLPEETRHKVHALYRSSAQHEVDAILGPNANTIMVEDEVHVGLFTKAARINHSCRPNAYYRFSERRLTMEVVAFSTIEQDDEILMSYVPLETPTESRRNYLKEHWGFDCTCSLCRGSETDIGDSENWRKQIKSVKETILDAKSQGFFPDAITMVHDWAKLSEWDKTPPFMPEYHDLLADLYLLNGDMVNATRYARMAVDGWVRLGSVDDEHLEKARVFLGRVDQLNERRK
ncbi:SET domain-protein 5 [Chaetomidium leptoderma]|uniref:SET domain-protein 5 n=1 Tax=Chaetomidium leptoderma TaxID=669021 RepID=A0AAN6VD88_9PEZI|nr:SET domain-protein 5 [Chaetomidium leptoderma]